MEEAEAEEKMEEEAEQEVKAEEESEADEEEVEGGESEGESVVAAAVAVVVTAVDIQDGLYVCIGDGGGPTHSSSIRTRATVAEVNGWRFTFPSWDTILVLLYLSLNIFIHGSLNRTFT